MFYKYGKELVCMMKNLFHRKPKSLGEGLKNIKRAFGIKDEMPIIQESGYRVYLTPDGDKVRFSCVDGIDIAKFLKSGTKSHYIRQIGKPQRMSNFYASIKKGNSSRYVLKAKFASLSSHADEQFDAKYGYTMYEYLKLFGQKPNIEHVNPKLSTTIIPHRTNMSI